jgi:hypothetical protein
MNYENKINKKIPSVGCFLSAYTVPTPSLHQIKIKENKYGQLPSPLFMTKIIKKKV